MRGMLAGMTNNITCWLEGVSYSPCRFWLAIASTCVPSVRGCLWRQGLISSMGLIMPVSCKVS